MGARVSQQFEMNEKNHNTSFAQVPGRLPPSGKTEGSQAE